MLRKVLLLMAVGTVVLGGPAVPQSERRGSKAEAETTQEITTSAMAETSVSNEVGDVDSETSFGTEVQTSKPESTTHAEEITTVVAAKPSTTAAPVVSTTKSRKTITFDQRQQGKFNIRADLENFMIVVVPSSPSAGISLLDLLNRSSQKKQHQKKKSVHRKNSKNSAHKKKQSITPEVVVLDESNSQARVDTEEFIEGRTPYKVDISSSARSDNSEIPSPIYRVVRPFMFNVEQPSSSNTIRFPSPSGNYYDSSLRASKSLLLPASFEDEIRTNTVYNTLLTDNYNNNGDGDESSSIDTSESHGSEEDLFYLMPERIFLDLPASHDSSFDSLAAYPHSDVDMTKLQLQPDDEQQGDGWDLKLLGAQEQCGPGAKRDSYGVCQFFAS
ncbi:uncharacterized protein LOC129746047 [Uranotaenia lowii]|uniref:uncharacterized protein LOC129746047 n=1 Tax=Uranotaenia lowii TaxID=190385 RepID=UPI00247AC811|nr:uncharacterized protein LOC129746047 [Uranotaenia lowii]